MLGCFWYISVEGWDFVSTLYFITTTFSTVGYGDLVPKTDASRIFTTLFAAFGIVFVINSVNGAASWLLRKLRPKDHEIVHPAWHIFHFLILFILLVSLIVVGTVFFCLSSDGEINLVESFYWSIITILTIGYGDFTPKTSYQKLFAMAYILSGVAIFSAIIAEVSSFQEDLEQRKKEKKMLEKMLDVNWIKQLDMNGNGEVLKEEFILAILCQLGIIDKEKDIDRWAKRFDELDVNKDGSLTPQDLELILALEEKSVKEKVLQETSTSFFGMNNKKLVKESTPLLLSQIINPKSTERQFEYDFELVQQLEK